MYQKKLIYYLTEIDFVRYGLLITRILFQVEYLYYSTIDDPTHDVTEVENASLEDMNHFIKLEESAMCMVSQNLPYQN